MSDAPAVVLYDGVCGFCNSSVQFIIKRDPAGRFRFAPLQSPVGQALAGEQGIDANRLDGLVLIADGKAWTKSSAALRIARHLVWPWPILLGFLAVPKLLRDWCYDCFAARRYRWFGRLETCPIPSAKDRARFLA